jgi:DNA-binding MarR family transcriptional regulator
MSLSVFDPSVQSQSVDAKIVVGLERVAEVFRILLWQQSRDTGLSPIQVQLLIFIAFHEPAKRRVGYLAKEFNLTKPTISDAVKVLVQKGFLERIDEPADSRSHSLKLTPAGQQVVEQTGGFATLLREIIGQLGEERKAVLYEGLFALIYQLQQRGVITIQRMCQTCAHYSYAGGGHYCGLLNIPLEANDLRLDCPEHQSAGA